MSNQKFTRTNSASDEAIDAAMNEALTKSPVPMPAGELPLKRQWDADLDAELEAAMAGFDPSTFDVKRPRTRATDRAHVPKENRGQELGPGTQKGKVIAIRGKSIFVDLGAKSEG